MADYFKKLLGITGSIFSLNKGSKQYRELTVDPSAGAGLAAPVGSIGVRDNSSVGELWLKYGSADTAWIKFQESHTAASEGESSHTGNQDWQEKLKLTTPSLISGDFLLHWSIEASFSNLAGDRSIRVQRNDADTLAEQKSEMHITYSNDGWEIHSGIWRSNISGVQVFDIDYKTFQNAQTVYVRRARLHLMRVM